MTSLVLCTVWRKWHKDVVITRKGSAVATCQPRGICVRSFVFLISIQLSNWLNESRFNSVDHRPSFYYCTVQSFDPLWILIRTHSAHALIPRALELVCAIWGIHLFIIYDSGSNLVLDVIDMQPTKRLYLWYLFALIYLIS